MAIRLEIRLLLHKKSIMVIQEEVGGCHHLVEGEEDPCKDCPWLMDLEVVMIKEGVAKV